MKSIIPTSAVFCFMASLASANTCVETDDALAIMIDQDGVRYTLLMTDEPVDFASDLPERDVSVYSLEELVGMGAMEQAISDLYLNVNGMFDKGEASRTLLIQSDADAYIQTTQVTTYVSYGDDIIDWSDVVNQAAFRNAYGQDKTDAINILANISRTALNKLTVVDGVCFVQNHGALTPNP